MDERNIEKLSLRSREKKRKYILLSYRDTRNGKKGYLLRLWGRGGGMTFVVISFSLFSPLPKQKKKDNSLGSTRKLYKKKKNNLYFSLK